MPKSGACERAKYDLLYQESRTSDKEGQTLESQESGTCKREGEALEGEEAMVPERSRRHFILLVAVRRKSNFVQGVPATEAAEAGYARKTVPEGSLDLCGVSPPIIRSLRAVRRAETKDTGNGRSEMGT